MRSAFSLLCLIASGFLPPVAAWGQVVNSIENPIGNAVVSVEKLEWTKPTSNAPVSVSLIVRNNTKEKVISTVQFTLVAQDKNNVILQNDGATLRKLSDNTQIHPGETGTIYFDKAFTITHIDNIELKQVIVQFTNGSLEILKK